MIALLLIITIITAVIVVSVAIGSALKIFYDFHETAPDWLEGFACALMSPKLFKDWKENEKEG